MCIVYQINFGKWSKNATLIFFVNKEQFSFNNNVSLNIFLLLILTILIKISCKCIHNNDCDKLNKTSSRSFSF